MPPESEITAELGIDNLSSPELPERTLPDVVLPLRFAAKTDLGRVRDNNEDKFDWWEPSDPLRLANRGRLYAVADGMGGHAAGQIASEMALNAFAASYYGTLKGSPEQALLRAMTQANAVVFDTARAVPSRSGMGCTMVAVAIVDADAVVAWAGDSRAYLIRDDSITQITRDHSWVEEQVQLGVITPEDARTHPYRNIIMRSLGPEASVSPEVVTANLMAGDTVLLCSDGLTGPLDDSDILSLATVDEPAFACRNLIELANARGGPDNITVALIQVAGDSGPAESSQPDAEETPRRWSLFRR